MTDSSSLQPWHSLHYHRIKAGLSLEQLADKAGLSRQYVGFLERGDKPRTDRATIRLATALGIEPTELRVDLHPSALDPAVFDRLETHLASISEQLTQLRTLHSARGAA